MTLIKLGNGKITCRLTVVLLKTIYLDLFYVYECLACVCLCVPDACQARSERALDSLEMEVSTAVNHVWVLGPESVSSARTASALTH